MKHLIGILCLVGSSLFLNAQDELAAVQDLGKSGLQIGQMMPDLTVKNVHNYTSNEIRFSNLKGKLVIIDFWATWCGACTSVLSKIDSLQKYYGNKVQFIAATYEDADKATPFLKDLQQRLKRNFSMPYITNARELAKRFPHRMLPHYVWISPKGKIIAFTSSNYVKKQYIDDALNNKQLALPVKADYKRAYSRDYPLLFNGNGGDGDNLIAHSVITGYTHGLSAGFYPTKINEKIAKLTALNCSIISLAGYAYSRNDQYYGRNRIVLHVKDSSKLLNAKNSTEWREKNCYCYEIIFPESNRPDKRPIISFKQDLDRFFPQYNIKEVKSKTLCWVLERSSTNEKYLTKGEKYSSSFSINGCTLRNASLWELYVQLNVFFLQKSVYPLENATGITQNVDLDLQCNMSDIEDINRALAKYDLKFTLKEAETELVEISDR